jgi:lipid II:glycine glycyltransferase (peptidoglycan interpeptide bridge formation enzyme)
MCDVVRWWQVLLTDRLWPKNTAERNVRITQKAKRGEKEKFAQIMAKTSERNASQLTGL